MFKCLLKRLLIFLSITSLLSAQKSVSDQSATGAIDNSAAVSVKPIPIAASPPSTCSVGMEYYNSTSNHKFMCVATNTWAQVDGGGSATLPFATTASSSTVTITSTAQPFGCNGNSISVAAGTGSAVRLAGSTSETLTIGLNCSNNHLVLLSATDTLTCTAGVFSGCDAGPSVTYDILLATIALTSGSGSWTFGTVTDQRAFLTANPPTAGDCISIVKSGSSVTYAVAAACTIRTIEQSFGSTASGAATLTADTRYQTIPFGCTISAWNITVNAGTATFDVWKIASGTAIPTVTNTITASALPAISTGTAIHSTVLTGWTTTVAPNDIIAIQLKTVATATFARLTIECDQ